MRYKNGECSGASDFGFYLGFSGKLRVDLEQELIKSQGYRISALEIYLFVLTV